MSTAELLLCADVPVQPSPSQVGNSSYDDRARSDSSRGFSQDRGYVGNSWKIPPRAAGRTITWTDYDPIVSVDEQRKRFKNLHKVLKSKVYLNKVSVRQWFMFPPVVTLDQ